MKQDRLYTSWWVWLLALALIWCFAKSPQKEECVTMKEQVGTESTLKEKYVITDEQVSIKSPSKGEYITMKEQVEGDAVFKIIEGDSNLLSGFQQLQREMKSDKTIATFVEQRMELPDYIRQKKTGFDEYLVQLVVINEDKVFAFKQKVRLDKVEFSEFVGTSTIPYSFICFFTPEDRNRLEEIRTQREKMRKIVEKPSRVKFEDIPSDAIIIGFDTYLDDTPIPGGAGFTPGAVIGDAFRDLGVIFSNNARATRSLGIPHSPPNRLTSTENGITGLAPIEVIFLRPAVYVGAWGFDFSLEAFDTQGKSLGSITHTDGTPYISKNPKELGFLGLRYSLGISKVVFSRAFPNQRLHGFQIDDFTFVPIDREKW